MESSNNIPTTISNQQFHPVVLYHNLSHPSLIEGNKASSYGVVFNAGAIWQLLETFMLESKINPMILQLLLTPIVPGVGVEQLDECVPSMFREVLPIMVPVGYDGLIGENEESVIFWRPLGVLPLRGLGRAW
ncbi:Hypothetical predicted protein [Olea europaea subsp. europaea]|uniref:Uncharacterized protein n=1 Tax=Olea europaea subsp. europaea TaxID=158383 RepID=A0A8S0SUY0_OLEEU|nr:Hypothetical predicted protein [Olea europaea subsp. europaea]